MKKMWLLVLLAGVLVGSADNAAARVRVVRRPWFPRAIVVGPWLGPLRFPGVVVVPATSPERAMAYLELKVSPSDAEIYINGEYNGEAGAFAATNSGLDLEPGQHTVMIQKKGYQTQNFYLKALPGGNFQLDVHLSPLSSSGKQAPATEENIQVDLDRAGIVLLKIEPADATVYIDDTNYGQASEYADDDSAINLRAGTHQIEIVRPGYRPYKSAVEVKPNASTDLTVTLEKEEKR